MPLSLAPSRIERMADLLELRLTSAGFASVMAATTHHVRLPLALPALDSPRWQSSLRAFAWGMRSVASTVLTLVLFATYLGIGALAHDTHFSLGWALASTAFIWAGPAQIILISTLGSGATALQAEIAVTVSAIRLFPMVVSVLPMLRTPQTKRRQLVLATHFIAVTLWVECFRLLPQVPRERRIAFTHGLGVGLLCVCLTATTIGYGLAAGLPQLFGAAILLMTPLAFLLSTARNCRQLADILALALGLALYPLAASLHSGVDILISGISAGTIAYAVHWWREQE
jgi:predicted branched-subunit amino acid permease